MPRRFALLLSAAAAFHDCVQPKSALRLPPSRRSRSHPPQDVPTEQLMQIRKQVQEEAQYFNESFQQLRMAQS